MTSLASKGKYSVTVEELNAYRDLFYAGYAGEEDTVECIYEFFMDYGYPMDTHTGVAMKVAQDYAALVEEEHDAEVHPMVARINSRKPFITRSRATT